MPDDDSTPAGRPADFLAQLNAMTARLWGLNAPLDPLSMNSLSSVTSLPSLPQLGSLSAAQFKAMTTAVAAQRLGIEAMTAQLQAFDEHLAALQTILEPLLEWSKTWATLEKQVSPGH